MKKLYSTLVAVLAISQLSYAQNTPWPSTTGTANVGIGVTTPAATLHVNSPTINTDRLALSTDGVDTWRIRHTNDNTESLVVGNDVGGTFATKVMTLAWNGNVGIGTTTPSTKLDVAGQGAFLQSMAIKSNTINSAELLMYKPNGGYYDLVSNNNGFQIYNSTTASAILNADNDGNFGINTTNTHGYKLAVYGSVIAESVTVKLHANWPDYVFKKEYQLPNLTSIKNYIDQNHHLPEMPSEQEVAKNGINLGEIVRLQTKKIEELTLYLIEKDKQVKELEDEALKLKKEQGDRIAALEKALTKLARNK